MNDEPIAFSCLHCGKRYRVAAVHAGAEVRCAHCKAELRVPKATPKPVDPNAGLVSFSCALCGTRMSEPAERAGERVACPDCGRQNPIPQPKKQARKPAAPKLEAYELYEGDQPHGVDLARAESATVHFACRVCQTHLQASPEEIGRPIACPDCGAETPVPRPRLQGKRSKTVTGSYEVESQADPTESIYAGLYESYTSAEPPAGYRDRAERVARGTTASGRLPPRGLRPLADVFGLFRSRAIVSVLLGITLGHALTGGLFFLSFTMFLSGGPFGTMGGFVLAGLGIVFGVITLGGTAAYALAVLEQSIEGAPSVADWPVTIPTEWFGDGTRLAVALCAAATPGGVIAALSGIEKVPTLLISVALLLPWVLLSQLDTGSAWGVFSPRLLRTLWRAPLGWLLFYTENAVLGCGLLATIVGLAQIAPPAIFLATPVTTAGLLLYAWLLGRLGWVVSHATPEE